VLNLSTTSWGRFGGMEV